MISDNPESDTQTREEIISPIIRIRDSIKSDSSCSNASKQRQRRQQGLHRQRRASRYVTRRVFLTHSPSCSPLTHHSLQPQDAGAHGGDSREEQAAVLPAAWLQGPRHLSQVPAASREPGASREEAVLLSPLLQEVQSEAPRQAPQVDAREEGGPLGRRQHCLSAGSQEEDPCLWSRCISRRTAREGEDRDERAPCDPALRPPLLGHPLSCHQFNSRSGGRERESFVLHSVSL